LTGVFIGLPIFLTWEVALPIAGWSYYRRTRVNQGNACRRSSELR
jgi:hypothetical protein